MNIWGNSEGVKHEQHDGETPTIVADWCERRQHERGSVRNLDFEVAFFVSVATLGESDERHHTAQQANHREEQAHSRRGDLLRAVRLLIKFLFELHCDRGHRDSIHKTFDC